MGGLAKLIYISNFSTAGFLSCILVLYNCSASQTECKAEFGRCAAAAPPGERETNTQTSAGNSLETLTNNQGRNEGLEVSVAKPSKVKTQADVYTPNLADGSGKIPQSKLAQLELSLCARLWTVDFGDSELSEI